MLLQQRRPTASCAPLGKCQKVQESDPYPPLSTAETHLCAGQVLLSAQKGLHGYNGESTVRARKMVKEPEHLLYKERLRESCGSKV